jgi:acetyltransferase
VTGEPRVADTAFGDLSPLLAPRSVAVIGASDREGNLGGIAVGYLKKFGYRGPVWPVNHGRTEVGGLPCYAKIRELLIEGEIGVAGPELVHDIGVIPSALVDVVDAAPLPCGRADSRRSARKVERQRQLEELCHGRHQAVRPQLPRHHQP